MPELLKNRYNENFIGSLSKDLVDAYEMFDAEKFSAYVFDKQWQDKELKQRMEHIADSLHQFLPADYSAAVQILEVVSAKCSGFEYMFLPAFVERYGLDEYAISISALEHFTEYASSEFAVRPFILKYPEKMMAQMSLWAYSSNVHVRRLASEGCRPRLPWAMSLPDFKRDPTPVLLILESLKNDESEYVRRSVANNLNDISKDNPKILIDIAKKWLGETTYTDKLVKHACRSLLKQANSEIMALFGFTKPAHILLNDFVVEESVNKGEALSFSFSLLSRKEKLGKLRIEYALYFVKKNGTLSPKVFKISESDNLSHKKSVIKAYSFREISTRKYYAGTHKLAIIINGVELGVASFELNS